MKNLYFLLLLSALCLAASCNKSDDELPPPEPEPELPAITTEGLNTVGCYINGEIWVAEVPFGAGLGGIRKIQSRIQYFKQATLVFLLKEGIMIIQLIKSLISFHLLKSLGFINWITMMKPIEIIIITVFITN